LLDGSTPRHRRHAYPVLSKEQIMEPAFDSLGAYRKLEKSGMPEPQAGATVEVVKDAMHNLVTKEYLTAELDRRFGAVDQQFRGVDKQFAAVDKQFSDMEKRFGEVDQRFTELKSDVNMRFTELKSDVDMRFTKLETKMGRGFAEMGRTQAWGFVYMGALLVAVASLLFAALQYFDREAPAARPVYYLGEPPAPPPALEPGAPPPQPRGAQ